ncbi:hypothetical protein [Palleronia caenipelagi]|uniref:Uncharacterized protein n=1 Tax=Palleronia caenipelagi TaxID=2489174 RepID=A0A547PS28_9RHOB|nr:hypothetical protein [Palleronia caenipelagi]TRD16938.1 hypothetical protein FEV53_13445 [Palleronia caenipelagi]
MLTASPRQFMPPEVLAQTIAASMIRALDRLPDGGDRPTYQAAFTNILLACEGNERPHMAYVPLCYARLMKERAQTDEDLEIACACIARAETFSDFVGRHTHGR